MLFHLEIFAEGCDENHWIGNSVYFLKINEILEKGIDYLLKITPTFTFRNSVHTLTRYLSIWTLILDQDSPKIETCIVNVYVHFHSVSTGQCLRMIASYPLFKF